MCPFGYVQKPIKVHDGLNSSPPMKASGPRSYTLFHGTQQAGIASGCFLLLITQHHKLGKVGGKGFVGLLLTLAAIVQRMTWQMTECAGECVCVCLFLLIEATSAHILVSTPMAFTSPKFPYGGH